jgi:hypothetical protein
VAYTPTFTASSSFDFSHVVTSSLLYKTPEISHLN